MTPTADLAARLRRHVEILAGTPRVPGEPEHRAAAAYIRSQMEQAGFFVREERTDEGGIPGRVGLSRRTPGRWRTGWHPRSTRASSGQASWDARLKLTRDWFESGHTFGYIEVVCE